MSQYLSYKGLLLTCDSDGMLPGRYLYTFHGGREFFCSVDYLPLGRMVRIEYLYVVKSGMPWIRRVWTIDEPIADDARLCHCGRTLDPVEKDVCYLCVEWGRIPPNKEEPVKDEPTD